MAYRRARGHGRLQGGGQELALVPSPRKLKKIIYMGSLFATLFLLYGTFLFMCLFATFSFIWRALFPCGGLFYLYEGPFLGLPKPPSPTKISVPPMHGGDIINV